MTRSRVASRKTSRPCRCFEITRSSVWVQATTHSTTSRTRSGSGWTPAWRPARHTASISGLSASRIVGACALLAVLWLAVRGAWRGRRSLRGGDALLAEGIFVSLMSFLVAGLFLHAAYPRYLWILVGFGFAAGQLARKAALSAPSPAPVAPEEPAVAGPIR